MAGTHNFQIGGLAFQITSDVAWSIIHEGSFTPLLTDRSPDIKINNKISGQPTQPNSRPFFDSGQSWRLYQEDGKWVIWVESQDRNPYLAGFFDVDFHKGEIYTATSPEETGKYIFPLGYPMGGILMTSLLGTGYGIMLHSCGVMAGNDGYLFAGVSNAGKTTTARLWRNIPDAQILNDDHNVIRKIDGGYRVFGTPWRGRERVAVSEEIPLLKKIFILKHAPENKAVRLHPAKAAAALLVRAFAPLWSAEAMAFTLQFLEDLCETIPCYEYGFVPGQSAVEYIRCMKSE